MQETLYKTSTPDASRLDGEGEALYLTSKTENGMNVYFVEQFHGWWDSSVKKYILGQRVLSSETFTTFDSAQALYNEQKESLARQGFKHSFSLNPYGPDPIYTLISVD
ncbi:hypothetical protein [Granulicella rosea]|uniref:hypothetical protein n=1 Tax=Granulicella rosea TaxID=474952 RepID=UPI00115CA412|nr:hypothetical protein [Granulicella rosea]